MRPPARTPAPRRRDERGFVAATRFRGCLVRCDLPRNDVAALLPSGVALTAAPRPAAGRHPVVFIFGEHDRSAVLFASLRLPTGVRFHEMVIAVPFVREADDARPAVFLPRVFSGEPVVTWSGNAHYGYAKRMVPMEWLGDTFVVGDEGGTLLAHAVVEPRGPWEPAMTSRGTGFPAALAHMPVLGCRGDGSLVRSHFEWTFDACWVRRLRASVTIDAPLGRGLKPGTHPGTTPDCLEVSGMGWRLSWPEP